MTNQTGKIIIRYAMVVRIFIVKVVHSLLFLLLTFSVGYILYCGMARSYSGFLLFITGFVFVESVVLIFNKWRCPLTDLTERLGAKRGSVTQYFCPEWFVPHVFRTYGVLFVLGLILLALRRG